ncbi:MAG: glutamate--tRNA ligase [Candidatus Wallbacteria bacterium HGW-Wallbacteria-1]|jgi:glutamyl-tRNA synthetase|uniref:Glutamate--tRNA ligase n=1 Tax=Candidatus Wallbacteria bacterium HGW-Wallbacteria-1 TaxID=2013854 RepID=A0A2N1PRD5_9BACT|nr:MAG: glutamate--tRNA ligase [Candidatus Wallbacteria bacterium HGW-Wallbacteria-1]
MSSEFTAPRVRFAPSPTGYVHVGSLRTALYNYLYARRNKGTLILRIEDTDQKRYVEGAVENLLSSMEWAGITFDEGPSQGGDFGPYYQSQRLELYKKHCQTLLDSGHAYRCFCTPERLEKLRAELMSQGKDSMYDGNCRALSSDEVSQRMANGEKSVVRLAMPVGEQISWKDIIRGEVTFDSSLIDDQVLVKSDGFPTYHLANVIDDHCMEITHVIRGEEWVSSTPKHLVLYKAFGWTPPQFAHLPLLLNSDRSKLSKRQGDVAVEDYRNKGYLPESLVNFIALLGWYPGDDREIFTLDELTETFSLEKVSKSGSVFDTAKLDFINEHYMKQLDSEAIAAMCLPFLAGSGLVTEAELKSRWDWFVRLVGYCGERIKKPELIVELTSFIFRENIEEYDPKAVKKFMACDTGIRALEGVLPIVRNIESFDRENLEKEISAFIVGSEIKMGKAIQPLRIACTGSSVSFGIFEILESLGREKSCDRLEKALAFARATMASNNQE